MSIRKGINHKHTRVIIADDESLQVYDDDSTLDNRRSYSISVGDGSESYKES